MGFPFCLHIDMTSCTKTTGSKYPSFQSFFTLSYCKTNRMYVILLWDVNLWYEILVWQKEVSGIVFFFPIHDVNSMLKGSEWYWPLCYSVEHILLFYRLWVMLEVSWKAVKYTFSCKHRRSAVTCHDGFIQEMTLSKICLWATVCE